MATYYDWKKWTDGFNRTFMELKQLYDTQFDEDAEVLIVPLWN